MAALRETMNYSNITINDPNIVKRFLQRSRFIEAVKLYPNPSVENKVLDFGGGDGELCLRLEDIDPASSFICYEPSSDMRKQARTKISEKSRISLTGTLDAIPPASIDIIYSLEVFEHLPEKETAEAIKHIYSFLKPGGTLIIGVPNELFLPAIYKGIFRMFRRYGEHDAQLKNMLQCAIGSPPRKRPVGEISPGKHYHSHHLGFDYRILETELREKFTYCKRVPSPFIFLGLWGSPEIYYVFRKNL
jgi:SAM-dependent methyltransferase